MLKIDSIRLPLLRGGKLAAVALMALVIGACTTDDNARRDAVNGGGANSNAANTATAPATGTTRTAPDAASAPAPPLPANIANSTIQSLDGDEFKLTDYKGKVVVLDLWATWCGPCRDEIPALIELGKEYGARGVEIIGITTDKRTTPDADEATALVRDFAREFNINYKLGWTNDDLDQLIVFGGSSIPQTLVIGRDGAVVMHHAGFSPARTPQKLRDAIEQALARG